MANVAVRIRIDHAKMSALVGPLATEAVKRGANVARDRYEHNIRTAGLVHHGHMASTVVAVLAPGRPVLYPAMFVGTPVNYAKYQEYGTRAHGPVKAKFLVFKPKGSATFVFAKWVRGVTPKKFALRALDSIRPTDFEA